VEWVAGYATSSAVRRLVRRAVTALDADALRHRAEQALATRCVQLMSNDAGDGMAWFGALLPEAQALAGYERVCDLAEQASDPDDPRSLEQVRADVFLDLLLGAHPDQPRHPHQPATGVPVNVTVLIDAQGVAQTGRYGPIPARTVRTLLDLTERTGGRVQTVVQEPVTCPGEHPDAGAHDPYQPPAGMRRTVQLRDQVCVYPGCAAPATSGDLDHTVPWPHGPTCPCNLAALCRHHHRLKHLDAGWTLVNHGNGHLTWTTPWNRNYPVTP
jgi:hypothetical protein